MTTFLQLCQNVARESGTLESSALSTVVGATGRLEKVVFWTREAWTRIQNDRDAWLFHRKEFSVDLIAGTARYRPEGSFQITDLAKWITARDEDGDWPVSLYDQDIGVSDEGQIAFIPWHTWRKAFDRGAQTNNRPTYYSVSPTNELVFGAIPDKAYKARGEYQRTAQELTLDTDIPLCPPRFHSIIQYRALMFLHEHDEAQFNLGGAAGNFVDILNDMERDQLPDISISGPLA